MRESKVICDACNNDITSTNNQIGYRLVLTTECKSHAPTSYGGMTLLHVIPPIDKDYHFCGLDCLKLWLSSKVE